ncbi:hypothetical protein [Geobacter argillaceus]|uniref:Uncharacterized protein n=1 Tax=Geobacter argillaceus TaxID=345631 RepID=A0A562VIN7_9BACT|nr:hypothetical protein [Geobacter argillaceus]TWJ17587.1 hypothetical protein JN12_02982 [Geobacter argillaceus]
MKKNMIVGIAMTFAIFSVSSVSASASNPGILVVNSVDKQAYNQFTQETEPLRVALKTKELELNKQYAYRDYEGGLHEGIDVGKITQLEAEINSLKDKINTVAKKYEFTILSGN